VMIVPHDANIAIRAMKSLLRNNKTALSTETM
jgi:hypothetical protein